MDNARIVCKISSTTGTKTSICNSHSVHYTELFNLASLSKYLQIEQENSPTPTPLMTVLSAVYYGVSILVAPPGGYS